MRDQLLATACQCLRVIESNTEVKRNNFGQSQSDFIINSSNREQDLVNPRSVYQKTEFTDKLGYILIELEKIEGSPLGVTVSGGVDANHPPIISAIKKNSVADLSDNLLVNDQILAVNGVATNHLRHDEISSLVRHADRRILLEIEYELPEKPNKEQILNTRSKTFTSVLRRANFGGYGTVLRGGFCMGNIQKSRPLTIMSVRQNSAADFDRRIKSGDRVLSVNGINLSRVSCEEALTILKHTEGEALFTIEYDIAIVNILNLENQPLLIEIDKLSTESLGVVLSNQTVTINSNSFQSIKSVSQYSMVELVAFQIQDILVASLAERCGALNVGDLILSIDGQRIVNMSHSDADQLLKGNNQTVITLEIISAKQPIKSAKNFHKQHATFPRASSQPYFFIHNSQDEEDTFDDPKPTHPTNKSFHNLTIDTNLAENRPNIEKKSIIRQSAISLPHDFTNNGQNNGKIESILVEITPNRFGKLGLNISSPNYEEKTEKLLEYPVVSYLEPFSPAFNSSVIQVNDKVVSINGMPTINRSINDLNGDIAGLNLTQPVIIGIQFDIVDVVDCKSGQFVAKLDKIFPALGVTLKSSPFGILISNVTPGSLAHRSGVLSAGDQILSINDTDTTHCSLEDAANLLKEAIKVVKIKVHKFYQSSFDSQQPELSPTNNQTVLDQMNLPKKSSVATASSKVIITIEIHRENSNEPLGIGLVQGEFAPIIGKVNPQSTVDSFLLVGDEILAVQNEPIKTIDQALSLIGGGSDVLTFTVARLRKYAVNSGSLGRCHRQKLESGSRVHSRDSAVDLVDVGNDESSENEDNCYGTTDGHIKCQTYDPQISNLNESCDGCREALLQEAQRHFKKSQEKLNLKSETPNKPKLKSSITETEVIYVNLCRKSEEESFGLAVATDRYKRGIFVSEIRENSVAESSSQMQKFDRIIQVNGTDTLTASCKQVVQLINQSANSLQLIIERKAPIKSLENAQISHHSILQDNEL